MKTGVYKSLDDAPLFGEFLKALPGDDEQDAEDAEDEEDHEQDRAAAAGIVEAAERTAASSSSAGPAPGKAVSKGDEELKQLRKSCKKSMHVACAILSRPELQIQARILFSLCVCGRVWLCPLMCADVGVGPP